MLIYEKNGALEVEVCPEQKETSADRWHHFSLTSKEILNWQVPDSDLCSPDAGQIRARSGQIHSTYRFSGWLRALRKVTRSHGKGTCEYCTWFFSYSDGGNCVSLSYDLSNRGGEGSRWMCSKYIGMSLSAQKTLLTEVGIPWGSSTSRSCPLHPKSEMGSLQILSRSKRPPNGFISMCSEGWILGLMCDGQASYSWPLLIALVRGFVKHIYFPFSK